MEELARLYYIRDYVLLVKCMLVLSVVVICFFMQSFVDGLHVTLGGWKIMFAGCRVKEPGNTIIAYIP